MALGAALILILQVKAPEHPLADALRFLARHQRPDGSWGERPESCSCPARKIAPVCDPGAAALLLRTLGDSDPARRDDAQAGLRALGESALPHLRTGEEDPDPEVRARCGELRSGLEVDRKEGSDAELTGLALLAFIGAGYSQLSRDEYNGISFGKVVKTGIQWLLDRQRESGRFDSNDPVADAIAALALSENYGMTAKAALKEEAQKAVDRIAAWKPANSRGLLWKGMALKSAELSELPYSKSAAESIRLIEGREDDLATTGTVLLWIFFHKNTRAPRIAALRSLSPAMGMESETRYFATFATFQLDGPSGGFWRAWRDDLRRTLLPRQHREKGDCRNDSWDGMADRGRIRVTALSAFNFEVYAR